MSQTDQPVTPAGADAEQEPPRGKAKWGKYGRKPVMLLAGVGLIDSIDRGILPGVLVAVQEDLGLNDFQLGLLDSAYVIVGLLLAVPAGYASDRGRRAKIVGATMFFWALMCAVTATVRNFGQFFATRAALGAGDTINDPAAQSLLADYYPAEVRGRAYSFIRVTPTLGRALGIVLGGAVAASLGWRAAFLLVCLPGVLLGIAVWRMPEPLRGESDGLAARAEPEADRTRSDLWSDLKTSFSIPSLRSLILGIAMANGALIGIGFWAAAYNARHSGMDLATAGGVTGALILLGAIGGTVAGGFVADKVRHRFPGAPMVTAGLSMGLGGIIIFFSVFDAVPVWTARVPMHIIAVGLLVGGLPATYAMVSEVALPKLRGTAFSLVKVASTVIGAFSPPLLGFIADRRAFETPTGEVVGNLAFGFQALVPLILLGAFLLIRGGKHVGDDRDRAQAQMLHDEALAAAREPSTTPAVRPVDAEGADALPFEGTEELEAVTDMAPAVVPAAPAPSRTERAGAAVRALRGAVAAHLLPLGAALSALSGVLVLVLGWRGTSRTTEVYEQIPYALSGGLLGVALLALAGLLWTGHAILRASRQRRERHELRRRALEDLRRELEDGPDG
jgi:MFS family permease